jgi:single-stranded DNA-binding protein
MSSGDTQITIAGNLVEDPELRFTPVGAAGGAVPHRIDAAVLR